MASIGDIVTGLRGVLDRIGVGRRSLSAGETAWSDAASGLAAVTDGSNQPEVADLVRLEAVTRDRLREAADSLSRCEAEINAMIARFAGAAARPPDVAEAVKSPPGDSYPPDAGWAAGLIDQPYSPVNSGVPVVAIVRATSSAKSFTWKPGSGRWTESAKRRLAYLNAPAWARRVDYHIEMQVAAWMVESGTRQVELVINREPCGERFGRGCHQALQAFLPSGYRLSVFGTRGGGRYFTCDYDGKAGA